MSGFDSPAWLLPHYRVLWSTRFNSKVLPRFGKYTESIALGDNAFRILPALTSRTLASVSDGERWGVSDGERWGVVPTLRLCLQAGHE